MANLLALAALLCWIPISAAMFLCLPIARALSLSYVMGWLLLPFVTYDFPGIPDFGKATAILLGSSIGLLLHRDASRALATFRMSWIDVPPIVLCVGVLVTSILNGLGTWDGVAGAFGMLCTWAGPYLLARLVYRSVDDLRALAESVLLGGLIYVPLCLFEIRMSPQLCNILYGFSPRGDMSIRFGGWRPSVFLECGLELGLWMTATCLVGYVLWHQGRQRRIYGLPVLPLLFVLLVTTVLCKSTGALVLLVMGLGCWVASRHLKTGKPVAILVLSAIAYVVIRGTGLYDGAEVVEITRQYVSEDRAGSLECRLKNEDLLSKKACEQPWFGWGAWGRYRVFNDEGTDISLTDGRWIIIFGQLGVIGLVGTYGTLLCPCIAAIRRYGRQLCLSEILAPVSALTIIVAVFSMDSLFNNFPNPIYLLSAGAVGSIAQLAPHHVFHEEAQPNRTAPGPAITRRRWPPPGRKRRAKTGA